MNRSTMNRSFGGGLVRGVNRAGVLAAAILAGGVGFASPASGAVTIIIGGGGIIISSGDAQRIVDTCVNRMMAPVDRTERLVNSWRDVGVRQLTIIGSRPPSAVKDRLIAAVADRYIRLIDRTGASTATLINREADACLARLTGFRAEQRFLDAVEAARLTQLDRLDEVKVNAIEAIVEAAEAAGG